MKYEIIFKNGQIKNVVSKDVNKVKNYITESFNKISSVKRIDESDSTRPCIIGFNQYNPKSISIGIKLPPHQIEWFKDQKDICKTITPNYNLILLSHNKKKMDIKEIPCNSLKEFKNWLATNHYQIYLENCEKYGKFYDKNLTDFVYEKGLSAKEFVKETLKKIKNSQLSDNSFSKSIIDLGTQEELVTNGDDWYFFYNAREFGRIIALDTESW